MCDVSPWLWLSRQMWLIFMCLWITCTFLFCCKLCGLRSGTLHSSHICAVHLSLNFLSSFYYLSMHLMHNCCSSDSFLFSPLVHSHTCCFLCAVTAVHEWMWRFCEGLPPTYSQFNVKASTPSLDFKSLALVSFLVTIPIGLFPHLSWFGLFCQCP